MPRALILAYHRVGPLQRDPQLLCVRPETLAAHLDMLRERFFPLPLEDLVAGLADGRLPGRAVAVTFDDGYADNLEAEGLLARAGTPGTLFVAAGCLGDPRGFWWDELEDLLLSPGRLPERLEIPAGERTLRFDLGRDAQWSENDALRHASWNVLAPGNPSPRHGVYRTLFGALLSLPHAVRRRGLDALRRAAGGGGAPDLRRRPLDPGELAAMDRRGVLRCGGHTLTHPVLSGLDEEAQRQEIFGGKTALENLLGRAVTSFAYPYGSAPHFTAATAALARQAGFACACATTPGAVAAGCDPWAMPRLLVRDIPAEDLAREMEQWLQ